MTSDTFDPNDDLNDNQQHPSSNDDLKHQVVKPPSVVGEEDISGDMPTESPDIDEELGKVGLSGDEEGIKPLGLDQDLTEEQ